MRILAVLWGTCSTTAFAESLQVAQLLRLPADGYVFVYEDGAFVAQTLAGWYHMARAPAFSLIPKQVRPNGFTRFIVSNDAWMFVAKRQGFNRTIQIQDEQGTIRLETEIIGLDVPIVYNLNHIVVHERGQWVLDGNRVDYPQRQDWTGSANPLVPNDRRTLVYSVTNWTDGKPPPSPVRAWMDIWRPRGGWERVGPPPGYHSVFPEALMANDWVAVRLTGDDLSKGIGLAVEGQVMDEKGHRKLVDGPVRFWRNGVYAGATPPDLPAPATMRDEPLTRQHFAVGKWGPLELYESHVFTSKWHVESKFFQAVAQLRFRLNGRWLSINEALPFFRGKHTDLRFHRESGGYLFFEDKGRRELLIVKLPEAWRR